MSNDIPTFAAELTTEGLELPVVSLTVTRTAGTKSDNITVGVVVDRGTIRDIDTSQFWKIRALTQLETDFPSEDLEIERLLINTSSLPAATDFREGTEEQKVNLSFTDVRSRWPRRGVLRGKRNFWHQRPIIPEQIVQTGIIPNYQLYEPQSLKSDGSLHTLEDILDEINDRLFGTVDDWGPDDSRAKAREIIPVNLDFGVATPAVQVLDKLADRFGIVVGLDWDSSITIDFLKDPQQSFRDRSPVGKERSLLSTAESTESRKIPSSVRAVPKNVYKEISLPYWEPAILSDGKMIDPSTGKPATRGTVLRLKDVIAQLDITIDDIKREAYKLKVAEREVGGTRKGTYQSNISKKGSREWRVRQIVDSAFRLWIPIIPDDKISELLKTQDKIRQERLEQIKTEEKRSEDPSQNELDLEKRTVRPLEWRAVALSLLQPPYIIPKDLWRVRDAFSVIADFSRYGLYAWYEQIAASIQLNLQRKREIVERTADNFTVSDYDKVEEALVRAALESQPENPIDRDDIVGLEEKEQGAGRTTIQGNIASFAQDRKLDENWKNAIREKFQNAFAYTNAALGPDAGQHTIKESVTVTITRGEVLPPPDNEDPAEMPGFKVEQWNPPPIGVFFVQFAGNANNLIESFDEKTGLLRFKEPIGLIRNSGWSRSAIELLIETIERSKGFYRRRFWEADPNRLYRPRPDVDPYLVLRTLYQESLRNTVSITDDGDLVVAERLKFVESFLKESDPLALNENVDAIVFDAAVAAVFAGGNEFKEKGVT